MCTRTVGAGGAIAARAARDGRRPGRAERAMSGEVNDTGELERVLLDDALAAASAASGTSYSRSHTVPLRSIGGGPFIENSRLAQTCIQNYSRQVGILD